MAGSIRWNLIAGGVGFVCTFIASLSSNVITTSLLRGLYSGLILFGIVFVLRFILGLAFVEGGQPENPADVSSSEESASGKGQHFDYTTPDVDQAELLTDADSGDSSSAQEGEQGFAPLNPPKLATKKEPDMDELAKALRHLSED